MARRTVTVSIDGISYELQQLPAKEGLAIYSRLLKLLGPMIRKSLSDPAIVGSAKSAAKKDSPEPDAEKPEDLQVSESAGVKLANIIIEGFETLEPEFLLELAEKFAAVSKGRLDGGTGLVELSAGDIFDQHFAGRYAHLTRWLLAHLKLNYSDFLAALASSASQSPAE